MEIWFPSPAVRVREAGDKSSVHHKDTETNKTTNHSLTHKNTSALPMDLKRMRKPLCALREHVLHTRKCQAGSEPAMLPLYHCATKSNVN